MEICFSWFFLLCMLFSDGFGSDQANDSFHQSLDPTESEFRTFIAKYNKSYAIGSEEYFIRLRVFQNNLEESAKLNSFRVHPDDAIYGVTKFFDMTPDEFKEKYLSGLKEEFRPVSSSTFEAHFSTLQMPKMQEIPQKFDWRSFGIITLPRDQGHCGSCWAEASVETIESMYAKLTQQLVPLSVQQMIDCSYDYVPILKGCNGGKCCSAFKWALETKTVIVPESAYPFAEMVQPCKMHQNVSTISGPKVTNVTCENFVNSELTILEQLVSVGPLSVGVDASNWRNYQGGVIQYHCGEVGRNHAALIVGYDLTAPHPYYILKNSWGTDFGHDGYVYIKYGSNVCLIAEEVSSVSVTV